MWWDTVRNRVAAVPWWCSGCSLVVILPLPFSLVSSPPSRPGGREEGEGGRSGMEEREMGEMGRIRLKEERQRGD